MVGVVIYKDFETGSYENMRLSMYEGDSFADIGRSNEFISCIVNLDTQNIKYDFSSSRRIKRPKDDEVLRIAQKLRDYLYKNSYVTIAEFSVRGEDINIRTSSVKSGVYDIPDIRAAFEKDTRDLYKLVSCQNDKSVLYVSVLCDVLNFCIGKIFLIEEPMFSFSSGAIYINAALFAHSRSAMRVLGLDIGVRRLIKTKRKRRHMLLFKSKPAYSLTPQGICGFSLYQNIILSYRTLRCDVYNILLDAMPSYKSDCQITSYILSLVENENINRYLRKFYDEILEFFRIYEHYFKSKSHIECVTIKELFAFVCDTDSRSDISKKAQAVSANMKFKSSLPHPDFYDSRGRAY